MGEPLRLHDIHGRYDSEARAKIDMFARISREAGITVTFGFAQLETSPDRWRDLLRWIGESEAEGAVRSIAEAAQSLGGASLRVSPSWGFVAGGDERVCQ